MSDTPTLTRIAGDHLSAEINLFGAELHSLRDAQGRDLQWNGDPTYWTGRAPILFPIVGAVAHDTIRIDGRDYPMAKHGFARRKHWQMIAHDDDAVTLRLEADGHTRAIYPFEFQLDLRFAIVGTVLSVTATLSNPGSVALPASFGFHPALRWPLPGGAARAAHRVRFAQDEPGPIRRIDQTGLLRPTPQPSPVEGSEFVVRDDLFVDDALIFDALASRSLRFGAPGGTTLKVDFPDMPLLGIWTKPGAPYLCIEPWHGIADPQGYAGEFRDKPGVIEVPAGGSHDFGMRIDIEAETL